MPESYAHGNVYQARLDLATGWRGATYNAHGPDVVCGFCLQLSRLDYELHLKPQATALLRDVIERAYGAAWLRQRDALVAMMTAIA